MRILSNYQISNVSNFYSGRNTIKQSNTQQRVNQPNFGSQPEQPRFVTKVDENLYRGARPGYYQLQELKNFGISTIIDFSTEYSDIDEREIAEELGMKYYRISFDSFSGPSDPKIKKFLDITNEVKKQNEKIYIHCLFGRDRTGLMVNLYKLYNGLPIQDDYENYLATKVLDNFRKRTQYQ